MSLSLVLIKPDGVAKGLVNEIIGAMVRCGEGHDNFNIVGKCMPIARSRDAMELLYQPHSNKPFFKMLINFLTSGTTYAMIVAGPHATLLARNVAMAYRKAYANPKVPMANVVHASESEEEARREIAAVYGNTASLELLLEFAKNS
jgi:nucleoside-diphosphate kinase